ncbi:hypothetical protein COO20_24650 [Thalassospira marina]|uniref:Uncharacterized protein n=1 Tax=Thalassospira marina TaxID=2048283 RepID=A0A2N3KD13_9PROT|nr:hypothetical protein COO20_24650 [Thalassospira marina]
MNLCPAASDDRKTSDKGKKSRPGGGAPTSVGLQESRSPKGWYPANTGAKRTERAGRTATLGKPVGVGTSWPERSQARSATGRLTSSRRDGLIGRTGQQCTGPGAPAMSIRAPYFFTGGVAGCPRSKG